jgi:protein-L-isoaspartate(D-aspartate) O-methyltransferase
MTVAESEERAQFTLAMRARGINDLGLLRALERAPRALFMPPRFADIAGRDIALPIGCGQTSPPPSIVAAMIGALDLKPEHRVCEIGTGTGYCAALLAQLANTIVSLERFQTLALEASARIKTFGLANVTVAWADGFEHHASRDRYDRVLVHGLIEPPGEAFRRLIRPGGVLVAVVDGPDRGEQHIVRLTDMTSGAADAADMGPAHAMRPLERGLARAL